MCLRIYCECNGYKKDEPLVGKKTGPIDPKGYIGCRFISHRTLASEFALAPAAQSPEVALYRLLTNSYKPGDMRGVDRQGGWTPLRRNLFWNNPAGKLGAGALDDGPPTSRVDGVDRTWTARGDAISAEDLEPVGSRLSWVSDGKGYVSLRRPERETGRSGSFPALANPNPAETNAYCFIGGHCICSGSTSPSRQEVSLHPIAHHCPSWWTSRRTEKKALARKLFGRY